MAQNPKPSKHNTNADTPAAVAAFFSALEHPAKREAQELCSLVLAAHPDIREGIKWNAPSFRTTEYFATTNLRLKRGIGLVLHLGAKVRDTAGLRDAIRDPEHLLTWVADDRATCGFADLAELRLKKPALQTLLQQWIAYV